MKYLRIFALIFLVFIFCLIVACGQGGNSNPVGVLGGGDTGYGKNAPTFESEDGGGDDESLVGTWRHDVAADEYEVLIFGADGSCVDLYYDSGYQYTMSGSYSVNGDYLTIIIPGLGQFTNRIELSNDSLTIYFDVPVTYYRVG